MGGALTVRLRAKGKSRPQTESSGGESRGGKHNPKVAGSNPAPAIKIIKAAMTVGLAAFLSIETDSRMPFIKILQVSI